MNKYNEIRALVIDYSFDSLGSSQEMTFSKLKDLGVVEFDYYGDRTFAYFKENGLTFEVDVSFDGDLGMLRSDYAVFFEKEKESASELDELKAIFETLQDPHLYCFRRDCFKSLKEHSVLDFKITRTQNLQEDAIESLSRFPDCQVQIDLIRDGENKKINIIISSRSLGFLRDIPTEYLRFLEKEGASCE